jgi:hypothetical protein
MVVRVGSQCSWSGLRGQSASVPPGPVRGQPHCSSNLHPGTQENVAASQVDASCGSMAPLWR